MLITLEGIDGSGKSTLHESLREPLADLDPLFTREPGATWVGDQVRRAIREQIDPVTEATLFVADHAAHLAKVVRPALAEGRLVISDRYSDSRYAYQSVTLAERNSGTGKMAAGNAQWLDHHPGQNIPLCFARG